MTTTTSSTDVNETGSDMIVRLGIFGLGGFGSNMVHQHATKYDPVDFPGRFLFAYNTDRALLHAQYPANANGNMAKWRSSNSLETMVLEDAANMKGKKTWGAGTVPQVGADATKAKRDDIRRHVENIDVALILAGEGKGTGQGAGPIVAELLNQMQIPTYAMVVSPFLDNGPAVHRRAMEGIRALRACVPTVVFQNEKIIEDPRLQKLSTKKSWEQLNEICIMGPLLMLSSLLQKPGNVNNIDLADLMRVCRDGNTTMAGFWEEGKGERSFDPDAIVSFLIDEQFQDPKIIKHAKTALLSFTGSFTPVETAKVKRALMQRMDKKSGDVEIIDGTDDSGSVDTPRSLGFFAATAWDNLDGQSITLSALPDDPLVLFESEPPRKLAVAALPVPDLLATTAPNSIEPVADQQLVAAAAQSAVPPTLPPVTPPADKRRAQPTRVVPQENVDFKVPVNGVLRRINPNPKDRDLYEKLIGLDKPTETQVREFIFLSDRLSKLVTDEDARIDIPEQYEAALPVHEGNGNGRRLWSRISGLAGGMFPRRIGSS